MTTLKIGELFAGYGGLGMGVQAALGGEIAWVSEFDKGPSKILAHRFPGVPNHGDITKIQWVPTCGAYEFDGCGRKATVLPDRSGWQCHHCQKLWPTAIGKVYWPEIPEPVDVLTGGSPCQDLSHAGARAGMTEGTRSNLWVAMREAIAQLRPGLVVWENVRGAYSAEATSELESDPRLLADTRRRDGQPVLRALGRVLGDLSDLGYDAQWHGLRAADVGAPHGRFRVFVVATPRDTPFAAWGGSQQQHLRAATGQAAEPGEPTGAASLLPTPTVSDSNGAGAHGDGGPDLRTAIAGLLPTPTTRDHKDHTIRRQPHRPDDIDTLSRALTVTLLPTPAVNDMGASYTPEEWDAWTDRMKTEHGNGNGHGKSLHVEAARLLPTPRAGDGEKGGPNQAGSSGDPMLPSAVQPQHWGQYAAAIHRWESLTRPAPEPTERDWEKWKARKYNRMASGKPVGMRGSIRFMIDGPPPRLSARFSEWLMGVPAGWITDVPGITRNEALKLAGNGVVPAQAAAALRIMLARAAALGVAA